MGKRITYIFIVISIILGGIGTVLFETHQFLSIVLIFLGIIGAILSVSTAHSQNKYLSDMLDIQATLFAKSGVGNPYFHLIKRDLDKRGFIKKPAELLLKAYQSNPNDIDILSMYLPALVLRLSFNNFVLHSKIVPNEVLFAKELVKKGKKLSPKSSVFFEAQGILFDVEKKHKQARKEFRRAGQLREDPYWRLLIATSYGMSGDHEKGLNEMEIAIKEGAQHALVDFYLGRALSNVGNYNHAIPLLKKSKNTFMSDIEINSRLADCYYFMGHIGRSGVYEIAIALSLFMFGKIRAAISHLRQAIFNFCISFTCIISKIIWKFSRRNKTIKNFHEKICPPFEPEFTLSCLELNKGHFAQAKVMLTKAINYSPSNWRIWNNLSIALSRLDEKYDALKAVDTAINLNPTNEYLRWNKEQIEKGLIGRIIDEAKFPKGFFDKDRLTRSNS